MVPEVLANECEIRDQGSNQRSVRGASSVMCVLAGVAFPSPPLCPLLPLLTPAPHPQLLSFSMINPHLHERKIHILHSDQALALWPPSPCTHPGRSALIHFVNDLTTPGFGTVSVASSKLKHPASPHLHSPHRPSREPLPRHGTSPALRCRSTRQCSPTLAQPAASLRAV
jgi:hypothetical protein